MHAKAFGVGTPVQRERSAVIGVRLAVAAVPLRRAPAVGHRTPWQIAEYSVSAGTGTGPGTYLRDGVDLTGDRD